MSSCYLLFLGTDEDKTKYPTVWLGSSDGWSVTVYCKVIIERKFRLYIHSAIDEHRTTIGKLWLRHAVYSIV